ncbi:GLPGLI family protein [Flavilitoribacter nigricans]|uniref:GLPGLI family protein n=1 Tax=Flavilitoribacter nigricans (strain ATCC 23147 / DSM 23189 / NBRC 102662 / NCIMB 1420 / SS-2) TaxID=1122177 RepID=A0A2D0N8S0_FLAN2|nr:GLPGLI family protein [Flavilitoribacter nigricans]PHN04780.1 hypothetical protein CRP01_19915 [Flavilitoribacter nigricans DSM 23189 = NBRC 102662]
MNKVILSLLLLIFSILFATDSSAQPVIEVEYYRPLDAADGGYLEGNFSYRLHCNSRESLFVFLTQDDIASDQRNNPGQLSLTIWLGDKEHWIYKDLPGKMLTEFQISIQENKYLIEDEVHPMQWEITPETKVIQGMPVKKARCEHRGRHYTAWFAPGIPLANGPWKLGGLPGLILEAYDDKKEVVFLFKAIRQLERVPISKPASKGRKVSLTKFLDLNKKETKQYFEFIEARMKSNGGDFNIDFDLKYKSWEYLK